MFRLFRMYYFNTFFLYRRPRETIRDFKAIYSNNKQQQSLLGLNRKLQISHHLQISVFLAELIARRTSGRRGICYHNL